MTHWKLILAYDGTPFHGWQIQPGLPTVQGLLAETLHRIVDERVLPQGSGRTDAGVHALGQVVSFTLLAPIPAANLHRALNRCLPPSVRVLSAEIVPPSFHARHSAQRKTYEYRIFPLKPSTSAGAPHLASEAWVQEPICPPFLAPYVWPCPWPLDLTALNHAAADILGTHDFTTFAAAGAEPGPPHLDPDTWDTEKAAAARSPVRTIYHSRWHAAENLFIFRVTGSGFLHHMVRNLVGTFVQAGAHRLSADSMPTLLAARDRAAGGPTAPATGLFLVSVDYPNSEPGTSILEPGL